MASARCCSNGLTTAARRDRAGESLLDHVVDALDKLSSDSAESAEALFRKHLPQALARGFELADEVCCKRFARSGSTATVAVFSQSWADEVDDPSELPPCAVLTVSADASPAPSPPPPAARAPQQQAGACTALFVSGMCSACVGHYCERWQRPLPKEKCRLPSGADAVALALVWPASIPAAGSQRWGL